MVGRQFKCRSLNEPGLGLFWEKGDAVLQYLRRGSSRRWFAAERRRMSHSGHSLPMHSPPVLRGVRNSLKAGEGRNGKSGLLLSRTFE
jgi:hypothetical protein